jgi:hypothetical protein
MNAELFQCQNTRIAVLELECPAPSLDNGYSVQSSPTVGSRATLRCNPEFLLSTNKADFNQTCYQNSSEPLRTFWSPTFEGICERENFLK